MIDRLLTLNFIVIIALTALLKIIGYRKIQPFKLYLLISTLLIVSCKVYNSIQYHHNMRLEFACGPHQQNCCDEPPAGDKCPRVQLQVGFEGEDKKKLKKIQYIDRKEGKYHDDFLLKYGSR